MPSSQALLFTEGPRSDVDHIISPAEEISAFEALWARFKTVKRMADLFERHDHKLPSQVARSEGLTAAEVEDARSRLRQMMPFSSYSALFYRDFEYPERLRDAKYPAEVLYYQGALDLLSSSCVSVVGTREPSEAGARRSRKIAQMLVAHGFTVMSGLADGIDTAAHLGALEAGGRTVAVIGTPLNTAYPRSNSDLQRRIGSEHLLASQVPFCLAAQRGWRENRVFFPERNKTMSALSLATVIVEASETSGTLVQARATLEQRRKLFILDSCFQAGLSWPDQYLTKGAVRVVSGDEIIDALPTSGN